MKVPTKPCCCVTTIWRTVVMDNHSDAGTPCREIDFSEIFDAGREVVDSDFSGSERGDGNSPAVSDQEEERISVGSEEIDVYGRTPPRDVRRQKERAKNFKRSKEKEKLLFVPVKNHTSHESSFSSPSSSGKGEQDRKKKRDETLLTTERAAQRKQKMESGFELDGERSHADSSKTPVEVPSIKIEYTNKAFRSLDFEASQSGKFGNATSSQTFLTTERPEDREQFYKTFSRLIQLGSKKQKESQSLSNVERQSSAECEQWQVELRQALWLELQAWHADRTMEDQDLYLMEKRTDVEAVLEEVINFRVKRNSGTQDHGTTLSSSDNQIRDSPESLGNVEGLSAKFSNESAKVVRTFSEAESFVAAHNLEVSSCASCAVNAGSELHRQDAVEEEKADKTHFDRKEVPDSQEDTQAPSADKTSTQEGLAGDSISENTHPRDHNLPRRRKVAFTLDTQSTPATEPQRPCEELKTAVEQVKALFHQVEKVERLYPTLRSLGEHNPRYHSEEFNSVMNTLSLWFNLTDDLYHKLHVMAKFLGVNATQTNTWEDWLDMGLQPEDHTQYASPGGPRRGSVSSDSDGSDVGEPILPALTPCSPGKNLDTPTRPAKRISAGISKWTSTSRYRPFVDRSIKKMGLSKLGKRIGDILDTTLMRCKKALTSGIPDSFIDEATQKVMQARHSLKKESYRAILSHEQAVRDRIEGIKGQAKPADSRSWSQRFAQIGLPSFRNLYLFLARITLDISHECLRLRLEHRPKGEPSSLSVRQLLRECKEVINGASLVKDYYVSMVDGILRPGDSDYDSLENSIEDYEEDLREILKIYFEYLHNALHVYQRLPHQASKGLKNHLETEWNFVRQKCRHIRGGEVEGGTRFCVMAAGLLQSTGDFLDSGLDHLCSDLHNKTDYRDDLKRKMLEACRGFKHLVNEARERACKALNFIKKLRSDLENAAKFSIDVSKADLLAKLKDTRHAQVVTRHTADLLMFVPKHLIEDKRAIVHLLNVCCGQAESMSQSSSAKLKDGYLILMPSGDENSKTAAWTGNTMCVNPTVDTAISLADVQVGGLILIVRSSKQLDLQRKLFQTEMKSSVGLERERTSSHQAIAESLSDLKEASLALQDGIVSAIQRVDQNLDLGTLYDDLEEGDRHLVQNTYVETMHTCYNFGFEYQREIARLVTGEGHDRLGQTLLAFAQRWMKFVMTRCERGRGTRPRWASQGLDFLTVACSPKTLQLLSEAEFQDLKKEINDCICHVIGSADSSISTSPVFKPQSPAMSPVFGKAGLLRPYSWPGKPPRTPPPRECPESRATSHRTMSDPIPPNGVADDPARSSIAEEIIEEEDSECGREMLPLRNSCVTAPDGPRLKRMRRKLREVERRREQKLLDRHAIGRRSHKRRDIASELINITNKRVPFKWQRGIKIGEGQFGKVYACVNLDSGELMAVKQIKFQLNDHGEIKELADEIKNFEGIKHKNLVCYYGMELHRDEMFIFMEYCADGTISDVSKVGLPEYLIRQYTFQILVAVNFLHDRGIVHRDIKGPNIFLSSDGFIKLGDFGSSIKLKDPFKTMHGEISNIRGTVAYMAPEVITLDKGAGYGRAADIWSVGCVVVEMGTGKPPWHECDNNWAIMYKVGGEDGKPAIPEKLSEEGKDFLDLCFQKDPHQRHTANELMDHSFAKV